MSVSADEQFRPSPPVRCESEHSHTAPSPPPLPVSLHALPSRNIPLFSKCFSRKLFTGRIFLTLIFSLFYLCSLEREHLPYLKTPDIMLERPRLKIVSCHFLEHPPSALQTPPYRFHRWYALVSRPSKCLPAVFRPDVEAQKNDTTPSKK